jgi:hypothetical protein
LDEFQNGGVQRIKPEINAEIEWDIIEKKTLPMDTGGGVKVLRC